MNSPQDRSPHILINTFTPVDGGIDALAAFQIDEMQDMRAEAASHGWRGNEVYRTRDGASLIVVTRFRSVEAKTSWATTDRFRRHVERLEPLIHDAVSVPVTLLATHSGSDDTY
ncbi:hypothetical protein [Dietzia sp. PP-33]|jgi:heme-degrading monooxygenase HmoA|uniref:hypothetical protein n=1 Tax=Dietzia sp. PP-33 TaxID=2957500 RepID=UPI0029B4ED73|nr:hypothetical protein [Dietzia sp. PP-33]MDX2358581.1 hypothetical protein [Dietzia sp. PP-33]